MPRVLLNTATALFACRTWLAREVSDANEHRATRYNFTRVCGQKGEPSSQEQGKRMVRLTEEQKKFYKDNGYVHLSNVLSGAELEEVAEEYEGLFRYKNNPKMESSWVGSDKTDRANTSNYTVKGIHNLQYHSAVFSRLLHHQGLLDALEDVMQTKNILLHHTKAHFKPPEHGAAYPMHQDYHYFRFKKHSMVAAFLHLDDSTPENGGLCVYPGSHKLGPVEDKGWIETAGNFHYADQEKYPMDKATPVIAKRGDIVIFSYLLLHGSPANLSPFPRRMLLIQVSSAEDEQDDDTRVRPGQSWVLRGRNVAREAVIAKRFDS